MTPATERLDSGPAHLDAQVVRGGAEVIERLTAEWAALCESTDADAPFHRPEWIRAYLAAFAPEAEIVLVTVRAEGRLAAVLPLVAEIGAIGGFPARKLRSAGNTHTCRYDLVCDSRGGEAVTRAVLAALLREPRWDVLELENVPRGGALARVVALAAEQGYRTHAAAALTPPYLDLTACEGRFERLSERLDAKFKANLRRRMRKLEALGGVGLVRGARADARLETFYALERAGWKGHESSAIACDTATRAFYDAVARAAEDGGSLAVYGLESGGREVAMYLGLYHRKRYYLLKTAYDESLRECSPGQLLTHEALRDLVAQGCIQFDFLGGMMAWKADWAPQLRPLDDLYVFRGSAGRALHAWRFRLRPAFARAVRTIRRAR